MIGLNLAVGLLVSVLPGEREIGDEAGVAGVVALNPRLHPLRTDQFTESIELLGLMQVDSQAVEAVIVTLRPVLMVSDK